MARGGDRTELMKEYSALVDRFTKLSSIIQKNFSLEGKMYDKSQDAIYEAEGSLKAIRAFIRGWKQNDTKNYDFMKKEVHNLISIAKSDVENCLKYCFNFKSED